MNTLTRTVDRLVAVGEAHRPPARGASGVVRPRVEARDAGTQEAHSSRGGSSGPGERPVAAPAPSLAPSGPAGHLARRMSLGTAGALLDALGSDEMRAVLRGLAGDVGQEAARAVARGLLEGAATPRAGAREQAPAGRAGEPERRSGDGASSRVAVERPRATPLTDEDRTHHEDRTHPGALEELAAGLVSGVVDGAARRAGPVRAATSSLVRGLAASGAAGVRAVVNAVIDVAVERHDDLARLTTELAHVAGASGSQGAVDVAVDTAEEQAGRRGTGDPTHEGGDPRRRPGGALAAVSDVGRAASAGATQGLRGELPGGARLGAGVALPVVVGVLVGAGGAAAWSAWRSGAR